MSCWLLQLTDDAWAVLSYDYIREDLWQAALCCEEYKTKPRPLSTVECYWYLYMETQDKQSNLHHSGMTCGWMD